MSKEFMKYVWCKGECVPENEATVSVTNRGFLYGEGIFRTLRLNDNRIENFLAHHLRLLHDCAKLKLEVPEVKSEWLKTLVRKNNAEKGVWRMKWIVPCTHDRKTDLIMTLDPFQTEGRPLRLCLYPLPNTSPTASIKTLSYLDHLFVQRYAQERFFDDAIMKSIEGYLTEVSMGNIFWREGDNFYFPDTSLSYLEGTTVTLLKKLCASQGWGVHAVKTQFEDLPNNIQFYICNALRGIVPISTIEEKSFPVNLEYTLFLNRLLRDFGTPFHLNLE